MSMTDEMTGQVSVVLFRYGTMTRAKKVKSPRPFDCYAVPADGGDAVILQGAENHRILFLQR